MYKADSKIAEEFIDHQEILETLEYARSNKSNRALIEQLIDKAAFGAEAAEGLRALAQQLETIGYRISTDRGDYH